MLLSRSQNFVDFPGLEIIVSTQRRERDTNDLNDDALELATGKRREQFYVCILLEFGPAKDEESV